MTRTFPLSLLFICFVGLPTWVLAQWQPVLKGDYYWPTVVQAQTNTVWVGMTEERNPNGLVRNIISSPDDGQTWSFVSRMATGSAYDDPPLAMVQFEGRLFGASQRGLFESTDGGLTWATLQTEGNFRSIRQLLIHKRKLVAVVPGYDGVVMTSADLGKTWQSNSLTDVQQVASRNDSLFACSRSYVFATGDDGKNWNKLQFLEGDLQSIAATTDGALLVGTRYNGIQLFNPAKKTWTKIVLKNQKGFSDQAITGTYIFGKTWLVTTEFRRDIFASIDEGANWFDVSAGLPANRGGGTIRSVAVSERSIFTVLSQAVYRRSLIELTPAYLAFPDSLVANVEPRDQTVLTWKRHTTDETAIRVERSVGTAGQFIQIATLPAGSTRYEDRDVQNGQTYTYRLQTVRGSERSPYSPVAPAIRPLRTCQPVGRILGNGLSGVQMLTPAKGFAIEDSYTHPDQQYLLQTLDSGRTWQPVAPGFIPGFISALVFVNDRRGYLVRSTELYRTNDGGRSWRLVLTGSTYLGKPFFLNERTGFISDGYGIQYRTTNGGETWNDAPGRLSGVRSGWFISSTVGFAVTGGGVLKSNDGGYTWVMAQAGNFNVVRFVSATTGFVAGESGFYRTEDAGLTWTQTVVTRRLQARFLQIEQNARGHLFTNGQYGNGGEKNSFLFRSVNNGLTWDSIPLPAVGTYVGMSFAGPVGCLVGPDRSIVMTYDDGASWQLRSIGPSRPGLINRIGNTLVTVEYSDRQIRIYWSRDAGESWQMSELTNPKPINDPPSFLLASPNRLLIVTRDQRSLTTDGGRTWQHQSLTFPTDYSLKTYLLDEDVIFTYGARRTGDGLDLFRSSNGGVSWQSVNMPSRPSTEIQFVSKMVGYTGGNYIGTFLRTTDGGQTWQEMAVTINGQRVWFSRIHFVTEQIGFVWETEQMYKTIDGGKTWRVLNIESSRQPFSWGSLFTLSFFRAPI